MPPLPATTYPGQPLSTIQSHTPGKGTYTSPHSQQIHASLSGTPTTIPSQNPQDLPNLSITRTANGREHRSGNGVAKTITSRQISNNNTLPTTNATVLARITRLSQKQANVSILVVDGHVCSDAFSGVIRREDIRGWEIDKVRVETAFAVGDVVRAVVISLGDQSSYYLSTARNELGVLLAMSQAGNQMVPVSWRAFRDPVTGVEEERKVAKPV